MSKSKNHLALLCTVIATLACSLDASDGMIQNDWPRFMGPNGDGVWIEKDTIDRFPDDGPTINWRTEIGAGYSGPAIAGGRLYVTDRTTDEGKGKEVENAIREAGQVAGGERVLCLNAETGKEIWSHSYDCPYSIAYPTGPRCTPTVDGDRVFTLGAMGKLICFESGDGTIVWEKELTTEYGTKPPPWGYSSHPVVVDDRLFVAVGGEGSGVVAFDKQTGVELWKSVTTFDIAYAPLVMYEHDQERQLIFWHADSVDSLDPETGKLYWRIKFPAERAQSQTSIAMPRITGNQILITDYYTGGLLLQVGSNPPSVKEIWRSCDSDPRNETALNSLMTTPVVRDGHAYGIANDSRGNGIFRCIEIATGKMLWTRTDWLTPQPKIFATAFIVENGDKYFLFNDIGELMIVRLSPQGFDELDRATVLEPTGVARGRNVAWCQPACAAGQLFVRNDKQIACVDLLDKNQTENKG